jgi:hypothetical protein
MNAKKAKALRREVKAMAEYMPQTAKRIGRRAKKLYAKERAR